MSPKPAIPFRFSVPTIILLCALALGLGVAPASAQGKYEKPPREVLDVLNAPLPPALILSPKRDLMVLAQPVIYPAISDLAAPMLRLAGIRFNPRNNATWSPSVGSIPRHPATPSTHTATPPDAPGSIATRLFTIHPRTAARSWHPLRPGERVG